ncbi:GNAT family N-acetyltransferase [Clostridium sp. UBA6640]|uniref:GNAT family N-acetyltransferase n=1 Tax=Clostridium sp. UBA6640 TaxID=1946370 RepID=UPI0025C1A917|nr:GNAT family N-acetyltransferase [Clostridium sp. UBA6640]
MIKQLDLKDEKVIEKILDIQIASYKIEAEIIGFDEIPPLKDTINSLKQCNETFYGYFIEDILVGIISYKIENNTLDIHRIAVHPSFFKRGIAKELINFIEKINDTKNIIVCTGKENIPAVNLHMKNGYKKIKDIKIKEGFYLTSFEKIL